MSNNKIIFDLIEKEEHRQRSGIELIASENFTSPDVMKACGSVLTNKYAEGYPGKRYYGGCEVIDEIETLAINNAKLLFGAEYANVQPHSGSQANAAVFQAFLKPGDKLLGFDLSHGGHLTHGSSVNFSGIFYETSFYGVDKETGLLNYEKISEIANKEKPNMIIAGASAYSRDMDFKKFREIADNVGAFLLADISHPSGLIAKGLLNDPLQLCDIVTTTTHKTLRGPRGGVIMMGKDFDNPWGYKNKKGDKKRMSTILNSAVFPGSQGGPLEHVIAAKAVAFGEAIQDNFFEYMLKVKQNAHCLSEGLSRLGYDIVSDGTDNHCLLIDLRSKNITGKDAEFALGQADITVNKNMVPFDDQSPFITSGIRIGSAAITTRGMTIDDMNLIVEYIDEAIYLHKNKKNIHSLSKKVNKTMSKFPIFKY